MGLNPFLTVVEDDELHEKRRQACLRIMLKARSMIADPAHWTQGTEHRQVHGTDRYCAIGSIKAAAKRYRQPQMATPLIDILDTKVEQVWGVGSIVGVNDFGVNDGQLDNSQARVIQAFDWMIDQLSQFKPPSTVPDELYDLPVVETVGKIRGSGADQSRENQAAHP